MRRRPSPLRTERLRPDGLKAADFTWDAAHMDTWITNPRAMFAATKMTYIGMENAKDRTDLIAYLKVATSTPS